MPQTHTLKCWPIPFQDLMDGLKTAEWRKNDRNFQTGDILHMREYIPAGQAAEIGGFMRWGAEPNGTYTGRELDVLVTHIINGPAYGIPEGFCMMSVQKDSTYHKRLHAVSLFKSLEELTTCLSGNVDSMANLRTVHTNALEVLAKARGEAPRQEGKGEQNA